MLVFASQKVVHNVRNEMAESIVPLRKKIKDSLTRQGMWNIRGLHRKGLAETEEGLAEPAKLPSFGGYSLETLPYLTLPYLGRNGRKEKSTFF